MGNLRFLATDSEAIVDCLVSHGLAPADFTVEKYTQERLDALMQDRGFNEGLSYDLTDQNVQGCLAANNSGVDVSDRLAADLSHDGA
ncbi:hypothetical protein G1C96_1782 [Bifidobacterium sp. DSM 109958]|uniref:Uncharacterized protein n=1 Tax=Bifidobacterium moraviense TaxID=2675323 RepID=A0A7Y0F379_9BIFI|nr:hypothetical protein [Bifidobacterium sp. DSM 109958]NMN01197.1 hypothetical protein [Bifidobacterium sp. DSM 109958]